MNKKKLISDVEKFISWCSREVGKYEEDLHDMNLSNECGCLPFESPLEQIIYCSIETLKRLNDIGRNSPMDIFIHPQHPIDKYRVDFLIRYVNTSKQETIKSVVVECDSQEFHERTEKERRYEKARDRFLIKMGYKTFYFTGREILENPCKIAREIICYLTELDETDIQLDSNIED